MHNNRILEKIKNKIKLNNKINIAEFIDIAMFDREDGYYIKKNPIGKDGDFITAPEISQVFGELIAGYYINYSHINNIGISDNKINYEFVEMGAGRGVFLNDFLYSCHKLASKNIAPAVNFIDNSEFNIIEVNHNLKNIQKEKLLDITRLINKNINHYQSFQHFRQDKLIANNKKILFFANELFDCLPIRQFINNGEIWQEIFVTINDEDNLSLTKKRLTEDENNWLENIISLQNTNQSVFEKGQSNSLFDSGNHNPYQGKVFEYSIEAEELMNEICKTIKENQGLAIIIDYGYDYNKYQNSLQSLYRHQHNHILSNIGEADITSLVNFRQLQSIAKNYNLASQLLEQGDFLKTIGIEIRRQQLLMSNSDINQQNLINTQIARLIDDDKMGKLFKILLIHNK